MAPPLAAAAMPTPHADAATTKQLQPPIKVSSHRAFKPPSSAVSAAALHFHAGTLVFSSPEMEGDYCRSQLERLVAADRRIALPHVLVHVGLLLKVIHSQASAGSIAVCLLATLSVILTAWLSSARPQLWARIREPCLAAGHVLYMLEGSSMLRSFAVVLCSPRLAMWLAAVMTSAVPWLLLDPLLLPIKYSRLRWVQPLSAATLLPSNSLRCSLNVSQCAAACSQFREAGAVLGLLGRLVSPAAALLGGGAADCACPAIMAYLQMFFGVVVLLRIAKERERRARLQHALHMGCEALADQLQSMEKPLAVEACELLFLGAVLWALAQQLPLLLP